MVTWFECRKHVQWRLYVNDSYWIAMQCTRKIFQLDGKKGKKRNLLHLKFSILCTDSIGTVYNLECIRLIEYIFLHHLSESHWILNKVLTLVTKLLAFFFKPKGSFIILRNNSFTSEKLKIQWSVHSAGHYRFSSLQKPLFNSI